MDEILIINQNDTVAVALADISKDTIIKLEDESVVQLNENITRGHKFAIRNIESGSNVIKYGVPIGHAISDIKIGDWVHTHNLKTNLDGNLSYEYEPNFENLKKVSKRTFMGYPRKNGNPGIRNEVWVLPTVGCINGMADRLAINMNAGRPDNVDGVYAFPHPYGCSQLGDDFENTAKAIIGLANHPNAGGILIIGLGCEGTSVEILKAKLGDYDKERIKFLVAQEVEDEFEKGIEILSELCELAAKSVRVSCDVSQLVVGLKCGGSDGFSGITANPLVGMFSDKLISAGGSTILTEVPEMFGAETFLMKRAIDKTVFDKIVKMINGFKDYFKSNNQPIYENPSPGNKEGGITTLEDKSLGCTQKGGTAPVVDVLDYGQHLCENGLNLLYSPGNDLVAASALAISGAQLVIFTTGRGTPFGCPVPTVKISTNSMLAQKKPHWIDFNAGRVLEGTSFANLSEELYDYIIKIAGGKETNNEEQGIRELAIFKTGVTL